MAIDLTPEQRDIGKANFARTAEGLTRRGFLRSLAVAGGSVALVTPAAYFGYKALEGRPVRAALIGGGDEGGVLVGEHNPDFLRFVAVCEIRPSNKRRIFEGDPHVPLRKGFKKVYGKEAARIKQYTDYKEMLAAHKDELEAVVIALPLFLHAQVAVDCMRFGQERGRPIHVLCEKLMAWNVLQCKKMVRVAHETGSILSIGHQRHYSMLYAHAAEVVGSGVLGDVKYIRALWHRNFSWPYGPETTTRPEDELVAGVLQPKFRDGWYNPVTHLDYDALKDVVKKYHFDSVEQLVRWRTYAATGGGLMAELGSHQLDACSIFLGKVHPLAVGGVGTRCFYGPGRNDRDIDDHVFVTYEFPGKDHARDRNDVVVVTYSSVSTNKFEEYGECIMGTRGTLVVEGEKTLMLYTEKDPLDKAKAGARSMEVGVSTNAPGKPALEASSTWGGPSPAPSGPSAGIAGTADAPVSRGYREEMEDFAYCVRLWDPKLGYARNADGGYRQRLPRCHGEVAMADAVIALTANQAMKTRQRIEFKHAWFDATSDAVPDPDSKPKEGADV
jgi:predicted dehydrogenase